jgi:hypothetical protein
MCIASAGLFSVRSVAGKEIEPATLPLPVDPFFSLQQKLMAADERGDADFGSSVALDGDTAVVGSKYDNIGENENQGSVYIFTRSNGVWTEQQKIIASDGAAYNFFGASVAISGDTLIIGAPNNTGTIAFQGAVYVFTRNGGVWTEQQKITPSDAALSDMFGEAVALDGDTLAVGVKYDDPGTIDLSDDRGSAYIFTRSGGVWTQQQKLTASDSARSDFFGEVIALDGDTVLVGASFDDIGSEFDRGSAYVFKRNGTVWTQQQKLTAIDGEILDHFGCSVTIDGDTLAVGAETDISVSAQGGSAYIFKRNGSTWTQQQKIRAIDGSLSDRFGGAVALSNDTLIVGARFHDIDANNNPGAAYVFKRIGTVWTEKQKLTASDGATDDFFGVRVAINGDTVLVGASNDDTDENFNQGSAYVFSLSSCPITIAPASLPNGLVDLPYEGQLIIDGGTEPYQISITGGTLPPGISMSPTGSLSGTPTMPGIYQFTINASDMTSGCSANLTYTVKMRNCSTLALDPPAVMDGVMGEPYGWSMWVTGGIAPYTFVAQAGLPAGLTLSPDGILSGIPTEYGEFNIRLLITDSKGCSNGAEMPMIILKSSVQCPGIAFSPDVLSDGFIGIPYEEQVTASGSIEPYEFAIHDGVLPPGISMSSSGLLSGTPTTPGTYDVIISVSHVGGACYDIRSYTIVVTSCPVLVPSPQSLPSGMVSEPYNETITATGGIAPYTFTMQSGLPPGMNMSSNGVLSGTPTMDGMFNIKLMITDAKGCSSKTSISIVILTSGVEPPGTSRNKRGSK